MYVIKSFREQLGLSMDEFAKKLNMSLSMYEKIEYGYREPSKKFIEKLKEDDYIFQQGQSREFQMNMNTGARTDIVIPVWIFKKENNNLIIQLTQNMLKFDFTKYKTFEDLLLHVKKVTSLLENDLNIILRLDLRYINQIDLDETNPVDWKNYIKALREVGFDGFLTIERECGDDPTADIKMAASFLKEII